MAKTCDPKCYELAEDWFLDLHIPTEAEVLSLACAIQQAIEDWCKDRELEAEAAHGDYIDRQIDEMKERRAR